jgi:hypothetical protein
MKTMPDANMLFASTHARASGLHRLSVGMALMLTRPRRIRVFPAGRGEHDSNQTESRRHAPERTGFRHFLRPTL